MEARRHVEGRAVGVAAEFERRCGVFVGLDRGEHGAQDDREPQALLQSIAVAVDQRMVRPGNGSARTQQDQRVEQRQAEGIDHVFDGSRRESPAHDIGQLAREQREIEPAPEPADEEHHFRGDEQDHAVAHVQLDDRRVVAAFGFLHDVAEPGEEGRDQAGNAEAEHEMRAGHFVHVEHHAAGEGQRRERADEGPDIGFEDVIFVIDVASHSTRVLGFALRVPLMRQCAGV